MVFTYFSATSTSTISLPFSTTLTSYIHTSYNFLQVQPAPIIPPQSVPSRSVKRVKEPDEHPTRHIAIVTAVATPSVLEPGRIPKRQKIMEDDDIDVDTDIDIGDVPMRGQRERFAKQTSRISSSGEKDMYDKEFMKQQAIRNRNTKRQKPLSENADDRQSGITSKPTAAKSANILASTSSSSAVRNCTHKWTTTLQWADSQWGKTLFTEKNFEVFSPPTIFPFSTSSSTSISARMNMSMSRSLVSTATVLKSALKVRNELAYFPPPAPYIESHYLNDEESPPPSPTNSNRLQNSPRRSVLPATSRSSCFSGNPASTSLINSDLFPPALETLSVSVKGRSKYPHNVNLNVTYSTEVFPITPTMSSNSTPAIRTQKMPLPMPSLTVDPSRPLASSTIPISLSNRPPPPDPPVPAYTSASAYPAPQYVSTHSSLIFGIPPLPHARPPPPPPLPLFPPPIGQIQNVVKELYQTDTRSDSIQVKTYISTSVPSNTSVAAYNSLTHKSHPNKENNDILRRQGTRIDFEEMKERNFTKIKIEDETEEQRNDSINSNDSKKIKGRSIYSSTHSNRQLDDTGASQKMQTESGGAIFHPPLPPRPPPPLYASIPPHANATGSTLTNTSFILPSPSSSSSSLALVAATPAAPTPKPSVNQYYIARFDVPR